MSHEQRLQLEYEKAFKENQDIKEVLSTLKKEARKALRITEMWDQQYDGQEILACLALFMSSYAAARSKQFAVLRAQEFIASLETEESEKCLQDMKTLMTGKPT